MRDNFSKNKNQHEVQRRQEQDFLNQVKELEELEKVRKATSVKAIKEDFMQSNATLLNKNQ